MLKSLINDRWTAYRKKDFARCRHLKFKIRLMITEAKQNWSSKISNQTKKPWTILSSLVTTKKKMFLIKIKKKKKKREYSSVFFLKKKKKKKKFLFYYFPPPPPPPQ